MINEESDKLDKLDRSPHKGKNAHDDGKTVLKKFARTDRRISISFARNNRCIGLKIVHDDYLHDTNASELRTYFRILKLKQKLR